MERRRLGKFSWQRADDVDSAPRSISSQLFGWENQQEMDMGPAGKYLMSERNGKMYGGIYNREPERANVSPNWLSTPT